MRENKLPSRKLSPKNGEKGVALIVALLAMLVLTGIGFALMLSSSTESLIHGSFRNSSLALYAARGGVEEARGRMGPDAVDAICIRIDCAVVPPAVVDDAIYILLDDAIDPTDPNCTYLLMSCADPDVPPGAITTVDTGQDTGDGEVSYAWVKITLATQAKLNRNLLDPGNLVGLDDTQIVYWRGTNLTTIAGDPAIPAYILTALSIAPGRATRWVREVIASSYLPAPPGPITLAGCPATFSGPSSNLSKVAGTDLSSEGDNGPAIGVTCDSDIPIIDASIPKQKKDDYVGEQSDGTNCDPCTTPVIQNVADDAGSEKLDDMYLDCGGLEELVRSITDMAAREGCCIYNGDIGSLSTPGTTTDPLINVINGDADISANDFPGAGVLLVTGTLRFQGYPTYNGLILVVGEGVMNVSGGGTGTITGSILIANTSTCSSPDDLPGPPSLTTSGGGTLQILYDKDWASPGDNTSPQVLSMNY